MLKKKNDWVPKRFFRQKFQLARAAPSPLPPLLLLLPGSLIIFSCSSYRSTHPYSPPALPPFFPFTSSLLARTMNNSIIIFNKLGVSATRGKRVHLLGLRCFGVSLALGNHAASSATVWISRSRGEKRHRERSGRERGEKRVGERKREAFFPLFFLLPFFLSFPCCRLPPSRAPPCFPITLVFPSPFVPLSLTFGPIYTSLSRLDIDPPVRPRRSSPLFIKAT